MATLRYRLDDLGWFSFEKLVQSLLKADLGLTVESWGGHSDLGRDAYAVTPLLFPDRSTLTNGPFLFQVKFVHAANAAGANWRPLLAKATLDERAKIQQRKNIGWWRDPRHYVLLTNCPLNSRSRQKLIGELGAELPTSVITLLGGTDVCDLLDRHPELRRSFPEILSLRDLNVLLSEAVSKQVLERSRAAIEESRDLVPVFVPTQAYEKAWRALQKYSFVVLDGPPEMGKTAIARTIALSLLLSDWQAVDCRDPSDFFSTLDESRKQIFVADDAFGRTEYDPVLGRMWERDLSRMFHCLDSRHRLIWTTRKHILMRALREMDLTGNAARFPDPGEVIVTADDLTTEERARILYRHSRAARLRADLRLLVRDTAVGVVKDSHFTPERIRRFVREVLPDIGMRLDGRTISAQTIEAEIHEAIRNPTDRMRKSFRKLSDSHRWILIAFLECDGPVQSDMLRKSFGRHRPAASSQDFTDCLDDLLGTFLKLRQGVYSWEGTRVDWIHPSYRDLVIDELSANQEQQIVFLKDISTTGVKLALSLAGGSSGERELPLMATPAAWATLAQRCEEITGFENDQTVAHLLEILSTAIAAGASVSPWQGEIERILRSVCELTVMRWNERGDPLDVSVLKSFISASDACKGLPEDLHIDATWESYSTAVEQSIDEGIDEPFLVDRWIALRDLIESHFGQFAATRAYDARQAAIESKLFDFIEEQVKAGAQLQDPDSNQSRGKWLEQLADAGVLLDRDGSREGMVSELYGLAEQYKENGPSDDDESYERDERSHTIGEFNIAALFEDL